MNGFEVAPLEHAGFLRRLIRSKIKANAIREIQNLLAERALADVTAADVENILSAYELPRHKVANALKDLYQAAVEFRVQDLSLSDEEIGELRRLRYVLGLGD